MIRLALAAAWIAIAIAGFHAFREQDWWGVATFASLAFLVVFAPWLTAPMREADNHDRTWRDL